VSRTASIGVFAALGLMAAVIKASNIPIAAVLVVAMLVVALWTNRQAASFQLLSSAAVICTIGLYGVLFLLGDRSSRQLNSLAWFGYARERFPDIVTLDDRALRYFASMLVLTSTFALPALVLLLYRHSVRTHIGRYAIVGWIGIGLGVVLATISGNAATGYFVSVAVMTAYLVPIGLLAGGLTVMNKSILTLVAIGGTGVGWFSHWSVRFVNGSSDTDVVARVILPSPLPWIAVGGCTTVIVGVLSPALRRSGIRYVLVGALFVMVGVGVSSIHRLDVGGELDPTAVSVAIGEPLERDVAAWIEENTPRDAIFATNKFCANCKGKEWFERDFALIGDDYNFVPTDTTLGGNDFRLTSLSRRRFLIQGPRYLLVNGYPIEEAAVRVRLSLEFANDPSSSASTALQRLGVGYFVVDTSLTDVRQWAPWGDEQFRNDQFVVLRLI
jgi:hypothetical protein